MGDIPDKLFRMTSVCESSTPHEVAEQILLLSKIEMQDAEGPPAE